jgi:integrase
MNPIFSFVIPVFNEEETLPALERAGGWRGRERRRCGPAEHKVVAAASRPCQVLEAWAAVAVGNFFRGVTAAELVPIGLHECRHTFDSLMHAAGTSLETIADLVGHSGTYMTDRYRTCATPPAAKPGARSTLC